MDFDIKNFLKKYYKEDDVVILACSAWPDSMFLLYEILKTNYKKNLVVCYFNHKLRKEADLEEEFLIKLGEKEGFKVEIGEWDIKAIRDKFYSGLSIEEVARKKRYDFFEAIMHIYNTDKIILAHHLDDKIETFMFNLLRGSKITWLINMQENSFWILRPLLNIEKKDILKYLDDNNLKYFIDESNFDNIYTRNKLRLDIIPMFEQINSNYKENISNLTNYLSSMKDFIDFEIKSFLEWFNDEKTIKNLGRYFEIEKFNLLSPFLQKEVIRYIFFISNNNSTIWLSESNINEIIKFVNWKNNKTIKEIKNLKMKKENKIIIY